MWLPTSLYERIPEFWFLMGLGFFAFGLYLGFDYTLIYVYLAIGVGCFARSLWTFFARRKYRAAKANRAVPEQDSSSENPEHA